MGRTYVAVLPKKRRVRGYYTLASGAVAFGLAPSEISRRLPRHPLPVVHLGRLAVDRSAQGKGLGETLLLDALKRVALLSETLGICGVEVYALNQKAKDFYLRFGFTDLVDDPLHLYLPMKLIRSLFPAATS
jgi:GNAT superfamily N-acetyltransferase